MIRRLQLLIRNDISLIRGKKFGLPDDWGRKAYDLQPGLIYIMNRFTQINLFLLRVLMRSLRRDGDMLPSFSRFQQISHKPRTGQVQYVPNKIFLTIFQVNSELF